MSNKKAWVILHNLINDGLLTEDESWVLAKALFIKEKEYVPTPVPVQMDYEQNPAENTPTTVEVKGFINNDRN